MITANTLIAIFTYERMVTYHSDRLSALLHSLNQVISRDAIVCVIDTSVHPSDRSRAELQRICARYGHLFPIRIFSTEHLRCLHTTLRQLGYSDFTSFISFENFACFRNVAILVACSLHCSTLLMLDDDSRVVDPAFLTTALDHVGPQHKPALLGKTGYYVEDSRSGPLTREVPTPASHAYCKFETHRLWPKAQLIAQTLRGHLSATCRFQKCPMALGGTLVLHRDLYERLPFDPFCPRGEDTDYMVTAWNEGIEFLFDQKHSVLHAPIEGRYNPCDKFKHDVERFMYMRDKIRTFERVSENDLQPYPGLFLSDDLERRALALCQDLYDTHASTRSSRVARVYLSVASQIQRAVFVDRKHMIACYVAFKDKWPHIVSGVRSMLAMDQLSKPVPYTPIGKGRGLMVPTSRGGCAHVQFE